VAAKLAQVEQIRAQREDERRMHAAETRSMLQEWTSNRARLERFDRSLITLAQERTRAALTAYRSGSGPLSAVLEARRNEIDTRMERVRLEMDTARIGAQLAYLVPNKHGLAESNSRRSGR
jgi:outer membrane protein TolC